MNYKPRKDNTNRVFTYFAAILNMCILSALIEMSYSLRLDSALFVRLDVFDGYLHTRYNFTSLTSAKSLVDCASVCLHNPECGSFFYLDHPDQLCQTHSVVFMTTDEAVESPSASYYKLTKAWCPHEQGFLLYRPADLCYLMGRSKVAWTVANESCHAIGSHLIDVKTTQISQHLQDFMRASSNLRDADVSIGASFDNGICRWSDASAVTWSDWKKYEPNNMETEFCVSANMGGALKWNNIECVVKRDYICQVDM